MLDATFTCAPPDLFPNSAIEALRVDRGTWADPPAVGFECRLAAGNHPVDLGLVARPSPGLPACIDAVFFEWDQLPSRALRAAPLCFHRFGTGISIAEATSTLAALAPDRDLGELAELPAGARVTDVGWLDARAAGWLRLGLLVDIDVACQLLARARRDESRDAVTAIVRSLAATYERVRVQVDLNPLRLVGIELVADQTPEGDGWGELFDLLMSRGLCAPERAVALQRWPATLPVRVAGVGWCALHRTLSHLKVSSFGPLHAKAYLFARLSELW